MGPNQSGNSLLMTTKYAIALYELLQLRANMDRSIETFPIERFRELMGVPPKTYARADNFQRKVIDPALLEVNGLSDMGVRIELGRLHSRAPIHSVTVAWWRKTGDDFRAAIEERTRSKLGRMARLRGLVETAEPLPSMLPLPLRDKINKTAQFMRETGASEEDVKAFIASQATEQA